VATGCFAQGEVNRITLQPSIDLPTQLVAEVDILLVYDSSIMTQLPFTQFEWISNRQSFIELFSGNMDVLHFTIAAGDEPIQVELPMRAENAAGILVFSSHEDPVAEAVDISFERDALLVVEAYGINVVPN